VIVVDEGAELRIITQPDHARFAAELFSVWRQRSFADHPRRRELLFAIREHDNGWREADAAPRVDPQRLRPHDFRSFPESERHSLWQRGILRFADEHPYASLLIAQHAASIHRPLSLDWQNLFRALEETRQEWLARAEIESRQVLEDYRFLALADALSLNFCSRSADPWTDSTITAVADGNRLLLEPFPLAGSTTLNVSVRWIPNQPYRTDSEVGSALARARWSRMPVRVAPL
jgi:hypothetical protein